MLRKIKQSSPMAYIIAILKQKYYFNCVFIILNRILSSKLFLYSKSYFEIAEWIIVIKQLGIQSNIYLRHMISTIVGRKFESKFISTLPA